MKIVQQRKRVKWVEYSRNFTWKDDPGAGFSFPCDKDGNVEDLNEAAQKNFDKCLSGEHDVDDNGVEVREGTYTEPKIGECDCGEEVVLDRFTNTCHGCGADYNTAGQRLAPRSQWGCETGEHWTDCY